MLKMPLPMRSSKSSRRPALALALQGGGAHGAFTWGVLDALLEADRFDIQALSGTSAGAMNAVALADGWQRGGPAGARERLGAFWTAVGASVSLDAFLVGAPDEPSLAPAARAMASWAQLFSPQQLNPMGLNPLREVLASCIDFERLRATAAPRLFIATTQANTGRLRLFQNAELSVDVLLASACLPTLQAAVVIDGQPYWDGGFSANPALFPLVREGADDLLIVCLSPLVYLDTPSSVEAIRERSLDFAFNASFLREARAIAELAAVARASRRHPAWAPLQWLASHRPFGRLELRLARLRTHLIDAQADLGHLAQETRLIAHMPFLNKLFALGRERARAWLDGPGLSVGQASSADLASLFGPEQALLAKA